MKISLAFRCWTYKPSLKWCRICWILVRSLCWDQIVGGKVEQSLIILVLWKIETFLGNMRTLKVRKQCDSMQSRLSETWKWAGNIYQEFQRYGSTHLSPVRLHIFKWNKSWHSILSKIHRILVNKVHMSINPQLEISSKHKPSKRDRCSVADCAMTVWLHFALYACAALQLDSGKLHVNDEICNPFGAKYSDKICTKGSWNRQSTTGHDQLVNSGNWTYK